MTQSYCLITMLLLGLCMYVQVLVLMVVMSYAGSVQASESTVQPTAQDCFVTHRANINITEMNICYLTTWPFASPPDPHILGATCSLSVCVRCLHAQSDLLQTKTGSTYLL